MISTLVVARVTTTFFPLYKWAVLPFLAHFLFKGGGGVFLQCRYDSLFYFFLYFFKITVDVRYYFILDSGAQHSGETFIWLMMWSPDSSGPRLAPCILITMLSTVFPVLGFVSLNPFGFHPAPRRLVVSRGLSKASVTDPGTLLIISPLNLFGVC